MAQPASLPRWGETAGGVVGGNEVEPNSGKKDIGYAAAVGGVGEAPLSGHLNWWMRLVYKWLQWFYGLIQGDLIPLGANWSAPAGNRIYRYGMGITGITMEVVAAAGASFNNIATIEYAPGFPVYIVGMLYRPSTGLQHVAIYCTDGETLKLWKYDNGASLVDPPAIGVGDVVTLSGAFPGQSPI